MSYNMKLTIDGLEQIWNEREIQLMVLLSFTLQLFLLFTGRLRGLNINGLLRVTVWLAYVGADLVAVYAIGLFSQYEDKYKSGRHSFHDTLPLIWAPFLLLHLGGQDTITAFSIEDNNLWLRHLLNLVIQVTLALYVFWKSMYRIDSQLLSSASFIFVAGIIKYGERTWALRNGSRDGLEKSSGYKGEQNNVDVTHSSKESYALQIVLLARGFLVEQTMLQLGDYVQGKFTNEFTKYDKREEKLKIILMELGMIYDLLYTKAMVLQRGAGVMFRCAAQILLTAAFVLFLKAKKHAYNEANVAITYTLFIGAMSMEACSVCMVIASPWTRAHMKEGSFLYRLCRNDCSILKTTRRKKKKWSSNSMGQYNLTDSQISGISSPLIRKAIAALGLEKHWINIWHVKNVNAEGVMDYIMEFFERSPEQRFRRLQFGQKLNYTLSLPFEHTIYRLHIYTDLHICRVRDHCPDRIKKAPLKALLEDCEKLSSYMTYLMHATSMFPFSGPLPTGVPGRLDITEKERLVYLEKLGEELTKEENSASPFQHPQAQDEQALTRSLKEMREMWVRLLLYVAGKCRAEVHARQLGNGGELLTVAWMLMAHYGLGDMATELNLLTSDDPSVPEIGSVVKVNGASWMSRPEGPLYAFNFSQNSSTSDGQEELRRLLQPYMRQLCGELMLVSTPEQIDGFLELSRHSESEEHEAGRRATSLSRQIERNEDSESGSGTSPEIKETDVKPEIHQEGGTQGGAN